MAMKHLMKHLLFTPALGSREKMFYGPLKGVPLNIFSATTWRRFTGHEKLLPGNL